MAKNIVPVLREASESVVNHGPALVYDGTAAGDRGAWRKATGKRALCACKWDADDADSEGKRMEAQADHCEWKKFTANRPLITANGEVITVNGEVITVYEQVITVNGKRSRRTGR